MLDPPTHPRKRRALTETPHQKQTGRHAHNPAPAQGRPHRLRQIRPGLLPAHRGAGRPRPPRLRRAAHPGPVARLHPPTAVCPEDRCPPEAGAAGAGHPRGTATGRVRRLEGGAPGEDGADAGHPEAVPPVEGGVGEAGEDIGAVPGHVLAAVRVEEVGQLPRELQGQGMCARVVRVRTGRSISEA